jgi:hypothetical protein
MPQSQETLRSWGGIASGIAVDKHGNVGLFLSRSHGKTLTASVGIGAKFTSLNYNSVTEMRGKGATVTGEIPLEVVGIPVGIGGSVEMNSDFELTGFGAQVTFGIGLPIPSLTNEISDTRMLAMSGKKFDKFVEKYDDAYKIVKKRLEEHSKVATGKANGDGFIRQISTDKRHIDFIKREGGMYEMIIGLDVRIIPNSSAPKGAVEVNYRENTFTGLMFKMDDNGDMIDSNGLKTGF